MRRPINEIAKEIRADWKNVSAYAEPYLVAMEEMVDITKPYYYDSGVSVVLYFLSNATSWRGEVARKIKKELNEQLKELKC
jgi:hypothetical protein